MAHKNRYTFVKKEESKDGKVSIRLGVVSALMFAADAIISAAFNGNAAAFTGVIAAAAMALSIYGFYVGMHALNDSRISPKYPVIGSILCGVVMVGWLTLFLTGL